MSTTKANKKTSRKKYTRTAPLCTYILERKAEGRQKFLQIVQERQGRLITPIENYQNNKRKMTIECKERHQFDITLCGLRAGHWCRQCKISLGESICVGALQHFFDVPFEKIRPDWLLNPETGKRLELDGFNANMKLAVEYKGIQHSKISTIFCQSPEELESQQRRDQYKYERCRELGIRLIIVPYYISATSIPKYIADKLLDFKIDVSPDKVRSFNFSHLKQTRTLKEKCMAIINQKQGQLICQLSDIESSVSRILIRCRNGHEWSTTPDNLFKHSQTFCPTCGRKQNTENKAKKSQARFAFLSTATGRRIHKEGIAKGLATKAARSFLKTQQILEANEKTCSFCKQIKALSDFNRRKSVPDGWSRICRGCTHQNLRKSKSEK